MALLIRSFLFLLLFLGGTAQAEENLQLFEQDIKAGLLYNFLKYTEWPPESLAGTASQIVVCIFDGDPFEPYLKPMGGRTVNQREINIRIVHNTAETSGCHLLFAGADDKERWSELWPFLAGKSVLTVSDGADFAESGGMIEFGEKDHHISVTLNMDAVTAAKLRVQDRLLKLVTVVHPGEKR